MKEQFSLKEMIARYVDGTATASEIDELNAALKADSEMRGWFLQYAHLDAALSQTPLHGTVLAPTKRPAWYWVATVFAAVTTAIGMLIIGRPWQEAPSTPAPEAFASLVAAQDAIWSDPNVELALHGGQLPPGLLRLQSGSVELHTVMGATVLLHAPVAMEFRSPQRILVESGRIVCRCPTEQSRMIVETPATEVIDLGTEFSVEAHPDLSTVVAVLSGEVQVGKTQPRVLHSGEAVRIRSDGILIVQPLNREEFAALQSSSLPANTGLRMENNLLRDAGFEEAFSSQTWSGTSGNLQQIPKLGRSGNAVRIFSNGIASWPQCRQEITTGDIGGKMVIGSAWAAPSERPLLSHQQAILKIAFINENGREFAFALQRFLSHNSSPNQYEKVQVAAIAPIGTQRVQLQLMFQTHLHETGAVIFDDASMVIDPIPHPANHSPTQD